MLIIRNSFGLVAVLILGGSVHAQISTEEAYKRLHDKQKVAASQPAAEPAPSAAIAAFESLASSLNDVLAKEDVDRSTVDACFGNLRGESYTFSGVIFGITPNRASGQILVRITLAPERASESLWKQYYRAVETEYEQRIKSIEDYRRTANRSGYGRGGSTTSNSSRFEAEIRSIQERREAALRDAKSRKPASPIVDLYLDVGLDVLKSAKKGQILKGRITVNDGTAESTTFHYEDTDITYAKRIQISASFGTDTDPPPKPVEPELPPASNEKNAR